MIEVLRKRFDKPRDLHIIHCRTLADLLPVKHNKQELSQVADTVFTAVTGIIRQGQENIKAIATSLAVSVLPKQLRTEWENKTETSKQVPDIFEWAGRKHPTQAMSRRQFLLNTLLTRRRDSSITTIVINPQDRGQLSTHLQLHLLQWKHNSQPDRLLSSPPDKLLSSKAVHQEAVHQGVLNTLLTGIHVVCVMNAILYMPVAPLER